MFLLNIYKLFQVTVDMAYAAGSIRQFQSHNQAQKKIIIELSKQHEPLLNDAMVCSK